eukprot:SAG11_NODE_170_length_13624_cov_40.078226_11_plen_53_part_00
MPEAQVNAQQNFEKLASDLAHEMDEAQVRLDASWRAILSRLGSERRKPWPST